MAWENFWSLENGKRVASRQQLNAFRSHFPDRVVELNAQIGRPLMMVLEKPYKLTSIRTAEAYELSPVLFRDIKGWPPSLSLSKFGHLPRKGQGDVVDAKVVPGERPSLPSTLRIQGDFDDQEAFSTIGGYPVILLECLAKSINEHAGESFQSLSDLELSEVD